MARLFLDLEVFSAAPLAEVGGYRYAMDPSTRVLLIAYAFDAEPVKVIDLEHGDSIPEHLRAALSDPAVEKWAHNAMFERAVITHTLGIPCPPEQWRCAMVQALTLTLPGSLDDLGAELRLADQKMTEGKRLIKKLVSQIMKSC